MGLDVNLQQIAEIAMLADQIHQFIESSSESPQQLVSSHTIINVRDEFWSLISFFANEIEGIRTNSEQGKDGIELITNNLLEDLI